MRKPTLLRNYRFTARVQQTTNQQFRVMRLNSVLAFSSLALLNGISAIKTQSEITTPVPATQLRADTIAAHPQQKQVANDGEHQLGLWD